MRGLGLVFILALCGSSVLGSGLAWAVVDQSGTWPDQTELWRSKLSRLAPCREFERMALDTNGPEEIKPGFHSQGLLVIRRGSVFYERYQEPFSRNSVFPLWSGTKTITSLLLGAAIQQKKISLDERLAADIPRPLSSEEDPWARKYYGDIRIRDLVTLGAGFDWHESYEDGARRSSVLPMLYLQGSLDQIAYAASRPMIPEGTGVKFNYSTGTFHLLSAALQKRMGKQDPRFPWTILFNPLGMTSVVFEKDAAGSYLGGSGAFATTRDFAKLGYLMLKKGVWGNQRVIPEEYVNFSLQVSPAYLSPLTVIKDSALEGVYGAGWWLNRAVKGNPAPYPDLPESLFMALGHYGQVIAVFPDKELLIVRNGNDMDYSRYLGPILKKGLECFGGEVL